MSSEGSTKDVRAIQREMKDNQLLKELDAALPPVFSRIESEWTEATTSARDAINRSDELTAARNAARSYKELSEAYNTAVAAIKQDRMLSPEGKLDALKRAADLKATKVQEIRASALSQASRLQSRFSERGLAPPTAEIQGEAALVISRFAHMGAGSFLKEASEKLRIASDPTAPAPERYRANVLLANSYAPLVQRRYEAPESYAEALAPAAEKLSEAITRHLDTVRGKASADAAREMAYNIESGFTFIENFQDKGGTWDLIPGALPELFPKVEE